MMAFYPDYPSDEIIPIITLLSNFIKREDYLIYPQFVREWQEYLIGALQMPGNRLIVKVRRQLPTDLSISLQKSACGRA
jgi:hypothetical protein